MMRKTLLAGAMAPALLAGTHYASAQAVVIEGPPPAAYVVPAAPPPPTYYYQYYAAPPPAPVIRYYRYDVPDDYDEVVVVRPRVRACGPGYRWTGDGCAYARW
jgi:hypothetical protein